MSSPYECKLSPEVLKKAVEELNEPEDNAVRLAMIEKLRTRFTEQEKDLHLIRTDDAFLLRFLRVRKFDQDRAYETLVNYHKNRKEWRELFDMVDDPKCIERYLSVGPVVPASGRAKDGTFALIVLPGIGLEDSKNPLMFLAAALLTIEKLLEDEEVQVCGITLVEDMSAFGLSLAVQIATSYAKRFIHMMQNSIPVRVKGINMVNEGLIFDALFAIVSNFMKDKMKKRLRIHGTDYTSLHKQIDPCNLPSFLGGTGPDLAVNYWKEQLLSTVGKGEDTSL